MLDGMVSWQKRPILVSRRGRREAPVHLPYWVGSHRHPPRVALRPARHPRDKNWPSRRISRPFFAVFRLSQVSTPRFQLPGATTRANGALVVARGSSRAWSSSATDRRLRRPRATPPDVCPLEPPISAKKVL